MTDKPAWTPGPWQAVPTNPAEGGEWYWIVGKRDGHNAEKEIGTVSGPQRGTQAANAALIAAAPDLYEALDEAVAFIAVWGATYQIQYGLDEVHPNHKQSLDKAQAALAKARGEQP